MACINVHRTTMLPHKPNIIHMPKEVTKDNMGHAPPGANVFDFSL